LGADGAAPSNYSRGFATFAGKISGFRFSVSDFRMFRGSLSFTAETAVPPSLFSQRPGGSAGEFARRAERRFADEVCVGNGVSTLPIFESFPRCSVALRLLVEQHFFVDS